MLVNVNKITFQGCRLHWSSSYFIITDKTKLVFGEFVKILMRVQSPLPSLTTHFKIPMRFSFLRRCLTSNTMLLRSGGSRVVLGVPIPKVVELTYYFANVFSENYMKTKEFGPRGGNASLAPPGICQ